MRAKLGGAGSTHIATVTRVGYRFIEPAEAA
jgi:DNA-binding winged helix-turn-helix (wHTH) protein